MSAEYYFKGIQSSSTTIKVLPDTLLSINDSLAFSATASLDTGSLKNYAWSYEVTGAFTIPISLTGKTSEISGGHRYLNSGSYHVVLKVTSDVDSTTSAERVVQVVLDSPTANAGQDITVHTTEMIRLHGEATDKLGRIIKTEWKIGDGPFMFGSTDTLFQAPTSAQDIAVQFRVTDDDGLSTTDTMQVHVNIGNESLYLAGIALSAITPGINFYPSTLNYSLTVPNTVYSTNVTITMAQQNTTATLAIGSNQAKAMVSNQSMPVDLAVGVNLISIVVSAEGGATKAYTLVITREKNANADLAALGVTPYVLNKSFSPSSTAYTLALKNEDSTLTVKPKTAEATATFTMSVNGLALDPAKLSSPIGLKVGSNTIEVTVLAENGTTKNYVLVATRDRNSNADLSALTFTNGIGPLEPTFTPGNLSYTLPGVGYKVSSIGIVATAAIPATSTIKISGNLITSGTVYTQNLNESLNTIPIVVTAENGTTKSYEVRIRRGRVIGIAAGPDYTVALKGDGTVVVWGNGSSGVTTIPPGLNGVTAVSAGSRHILALKSDGTVVAWGEDGYGQSTVPPGLVRVTAIAAGGLHGVALKENGNVVAWGFNDKGETDVPQDLFGVKAIAAGDDHTVALKGDGTLVAWGLYYFNVLDIPPGLTDVIAIAACGSHSAALRANGTVVAWGGQNYYGENSIPQDLAGVTAIAAGNYHTIALKGDGTVVVWSKQAPAPIGLKGVTAIAGHGGYTVALKGDGTLVIWGPIGSGETIIPPGVNP